ncbi:MAG: hypothetical protein ACREOM_03725, partial [Candidatus Dormibacteraceae bacterium]
MSKRKRATPAKASDGTERAPVTEPPDDAAAKEDMAHVSPDILAGSPDIFSSRANEPEPASESAPADELPEVVSEPIEPQAPIESLAEASEQNTTLSSEVEPAFAPAFPAAHTATTTGVTYPARPPRRAGSSISLGIVLVVIGLFALGVVMFGVDLTK